MQPCPRHGHYRSPAAREWHSLYNSGWRRYRLAYIREHPFCCDPLRIHGPLVPTACVDHIEPHHGDAGLFWDPANHRPLCIACNSRLAAMGQGGFGNPASGEYRGGVESLG